ncbi:MAG: DNA polymerase III subunit delta' [Acidiferrobacteraceae bacterium]
MSLAPATPCPCPWHLPLWSRLWASERLGHAMLFTGPEGVGKRLLARAVADTLLCQTPGAAGPCGTCRSCVLTAAGTHPDRFVVAAPEEGEGQGIGVDEIRRLAEFASLRPHTSARKVALILDADLLTLNAANALLKGLEEPPTDSFLLLVSDHPRRLPITVLSRCIRLSVPVPEVAVGMAWLRERQGPAEGVEHDQMALALELAGGAPLRALTLLTETDLLNNIKLFRDDLGALHEQVADVVTVAARWKKAGAASALAWLYRHLGRLIREQLMARRQGAARLQAEAQALDLRKLFHFSDSVAEALRVAGGPLDEVLLLEDVLIHWTRLARRRMT